MKVKLHFVACLFGPHNVKQTATKEGMKMYLENKFYF